MKLSATFPALLVITALIGCKGPYITTGDSGIPSPDGSMRVILTGHGEHGHPYADRTEKSLDVAIVRGALPNRKVMYSHRYKYSAADLCGHVEWNSTNNVVVYVYDYADGVSAGAAQKSGAPSNHLATLSFEYDTQWATFSEKK